ncbi:MAG TPA: CotH kinase family protein [Bacteroidales bacterium]|nr:CotH kinase family protein [Bacteroidales bacterium]
MRKHLFSTAIVLSLLFFKSFTLSAQTVRINEVMSSNAAVLTDEDGDYPDWIELYNAGTSAINLEDYGLSDDEEEPFRWVFPDVSLQPNSFLVVFASGKNRKPLSGNLHTDFSISAQGEMLLLTTPNGIRVDSVDCPALQTDISFGRLGNEPEVWKYFVPSSPGQINADSGYGMLSPEVTVSHASGYYAADFLLQLSTTDDAVIYYTTDGSIPDTSSQVFSQAIVVHSRLGEPNTISMIRTNNNFDPGPPYYEGWQPPLGEVYKINVIRTRTLHPDAPPGPVKSLSYFVDPLMNNRYSLPVFSLTTNNENLFDDEIGIYVYGNHENYFQDGMEWERPANLSFFEADGTLAFNEDIGIRTHGNTSRSRPRKSLRVSTRNEYGNSWLTYQLFPDKNLNQFKRFILRNSGNDWDQAVFRDGFLQSLMKNLDVDGQYYRPAIVFINGEYWGVHNIRDRYDEHYIEAKYGIPEMQMTIMENNGEYKFGNAAGQSHYSSMRNYVYTHSLVNDNYFNELATKMDVESFTDMQIAHIFVMNTDWPGNNTLYWRFIRNGYDPQALNGRDGRWRWMLLDMDFGFGLDFNYVPGVNQGPSHNTLDMALEANGPGWPNPDWSTFFLRNMVKNVKYKQYFVNRFCDLLNTDFNETKVVYLLDSVKNMLEPEMQEHINRWRRPVSMDEWHARVQTMKSFAQLRPAYIRQHLKSQFNLAPTARLTISNNQYQMGRVKVNSVIIPQAQYWTGTYFQQIPQQLTALPNPGYRFVRWEGGINQNSETVTFTMSADMLISAVFELSDDFQGDSINPAAWRLANGAYKFDYWDESQPERTYPANMVFLQSEKNDPELPDELTRPYYIPQNEYHSDDATSVGFPYRLTRRTRLNGLAASGISFINTGRGRDLGAAVLAIDTRGMEDVTVGWTAGTVTPNSRAYAIRLQYRVGRQGQFTDVTDENSYPIEYQRAATAGHSQVFEPVQLPDMVEDQAYVQLRWKYYYTGQQLDPNSGSRDMLRLDDVVVSTVTMGVEENPSASAGVEVRSYPNPFSQSCSIEVELQQKESLLLEIFNAQGMLVTTICDGKFDTGIHSFELDGTQLPAGNYFYRLRTDEKLLRGKLMLIR